MSRKSRNKHGVPQAPMPPAAKAELVVQTMDQVLNDKSVVDVIVKNGLQEALGLNSGLAGLGFPQNQGTGFTTQISEPTTGFINLRWWLISNLRQFLSQAYVEFGLVQTIVDVPVDDGLRGGIEVKSKQLSEEQIAELLVSLDRDDDITTAGQAAKWNRLYGGAGILILTDQDPEEPLDLKHISKDTPLEFRAVDMWELFWDKQNSEGYDPAIQSEDFEFYNYYGEQVHKSRVMRLKGLTAPSFIRPRLRGWGFSIVEHLVRPINQFLKAQSLTFEVLDEFKVDIYKIKNLTNSLLSKQGEEQVRRRVGIANAQKNFQNAVVMDIEDDWDHKQLSFTGMAEVMKEIRMQIASDMRMPLTKLFGISAAGFNSGEDDIEVYNAMVESQVRNKLKYDLLRICEIKCQKLFSFVPDDISISFKPLRVLSAVDEETVKTQKFTRIMQAKAAGELTTLEFRDACNKGDLFDITLDTDEASLGLIEDVKDEASDMGMDPEKNTDIDNPGANRADTQKSRATEVGGAPKGEVKQAPKTPAMKNAEFDESKHPRADDGKFGKGGGAKGTESKKAKGSPGSKIKPGGANEKARQRVLAGMFKRTDKRVEALGAKFDKSQSPEDEAELSKAIAERSQIQAAMLGIELREAKAESSPEVAALEAKLAEIKTKKEALQKASEESKARTAALKEKLERSKGGGKPKVEAISRDKLIAKDDLKKILAETKPQFEAIGKSKPELAQAITDWSGAGYIYARALQQGNQEILDLDKGHGSGVELGESILKEFSENFESLPSYSGPLVRDLNIEISKGLELFKAGDTFETDAYTSFTACEGYSRRKVRIIVEHSKSGKAAWGLCRDDIEGEVIIPKGVKYKIERVERREESPYVVVHVKEVSDE